MDIREIQKYAEYQVLCAYGLDKLAGMPPALPAAALAAIKRPAMAASAAPDWKTKLLMQGKKGLSPSQILGI